jgi:hypothetical protein
LELDSGLDEAGLGGWRRSGGVGDTVASCVGGEEAEAALFFFMMPPKMFFIVCGNELCTLTYGKWRRKNVGRKDVEGQTDRQRQSKQTNGRDVCAKRT